MNNVQSLSTWFNILNWKSSPLFGPCHNLPLRELELQYFACEKIIRLERDIFQAFNDGNTSSVRLHGDIGCGKTTFSYYLMKKCEEHKKHNSEYVFYIFHSNRADDESEYRELTRGEIKNAWRKYFISCGNEETFNIINNQNGSRKDRINKLSTYYKSNIKKFKKKLIFIIDDVDLLEGDMPYNIVSSVKKDIELASVIRWISIRPNTFGNYDTKTKKLLGEFFPTTYKMPSANLSEVISKRIDAISTSTDVKNPFSQNLCDSILQALHEGNKREALGSMKAILEDSLPKKINEDTSESFIQNYIEKNAINSFISNDHLSNIHEPIFRSVNNYPITYDIIQILKHTSHKNILFGSLNTIALKRSRADEKLSKSEKKYQTRESDMNYSLDILIEANIIIRTSPDYYKLTEPGKILQMYSLRDHYNNVCKKLLKNIDSSEDYWRYMLMPLNYENIVQSHYLWKDPVT